MAVVGSDGELVGGVGPQAVEVECGSGTSGVAGTAGEFAGGALEDVDDVVVDGQQVGLRRIPGEAQSRCVDHRDLNTFSVHQAGGPVKSDAQVPRIGVWRP